LVQNFGVPFNDGVFFAGINDGTILQVELVLADEFLYFFLLPRRIG